MSDQLNSDVTTPTLLADLFTMLLTWFDKATLEERTPCFALDGVDIEEADLIIERVMTLREDCDAPPCFEAKSDFWLTGVWGLY